jgi:hypothetical protein
LVPGRTAGLAIAAAVGALTLAFCSVTTRAGQPAAQDNPATRHDGIGIWKYYVPHDVKGELDSYDPIGLIAGALIKADCSINWRDQDGKLYCFASGTSLVYFQSWPQTYIRRACEALDRLTQPKPGS